MITRYIVSQIMGYTIIGMSLYLLAIGILSDMGITEGFTVRQTSGFALGGFVIGSILAWKVFFCVPKEE